MPRLSPPPAERPSGHLLPLLSLVCFLAVWAAVSAWSGWGDYVLPGPLRVAEVLVADAPVWAPSSCRPWA